MLEDGMSFWVAACQKQPDGCHARAILWRSSLTAVRFPNVSTKGRGYQIRAMTKGPEGWEELRKVSFWQTAEALQEEMENKMVGVLCRELSMQARNESRMEMSHRINLSFPRSQ